MALALKLSTGLRNHVQNTGSRRSALELGQIKIYAGVVPATADAAEGAAQALVALTRDGLVLAPGGTNGLQFEAALSAGALVKLAAETWQGTVANPSALPFSFFRWVMHGDTGLLSTTQIRLQGSVGVTAGQFDMVVDTLTPADASLFTLDNFTLNAPLS